ncbi:MAG: M28 family peptidase [Armatimonadetes bacterium]|nr:M28 family peptidase [Armatimonadota bacterium]
MSLSRRALAFAVGLSLTASSFAINFNFGPADSIDSDRLKAHLTFIASDLLKGRDTPSEGLDIAAAYIASQLKLTGVQPAGEDGTYFQKMWMVRSKLNLEKTSVMAGDLALKAGTDFLPTGLSAGMVSGNAIYIAGGYANAKENINPYAGKAVKGKVVFTDYSLPEGVQMRDVFRNPDWQRPEQAAMANGAIAVVRIVNNGTGAWQNQLDRMTQGSGRFTPEWTLGEGASIPAISMTESAAKSVFPAGMSGSAVGSKVTIDLGVEVERTYSNNVIGIVPGSDPKLKEEMISIGAHYDHVGVGRADNNGDTIYNGADDDGSGTVALLEMSRVVAQGPRPKRSMMFIWYCGEEKGLLGSEYFVNHPTVDLKKMRLNINVDMIGRAKQAGDTNPANNMLAGQNETYVIGPRVISSQLDPILRGVNDKYLKLKLNDHYDSLSDPERIFYRSDHISWVGKGVPAIFFFSGAHEDYHRPSDQVEKIDFTNMTKIARTIFAMLFEVGNMDNPPVIDQVIPGVWDPKNSGG